MLFYHFDVVQNSPFAPQRASKEAKLMLRVDSDVESCTDNAVRYLGERGWVITGVRRAQQSETEQEFAGDPTLLEMYHDAKEQGIACAIGQGRLMAACEPAGAHA